MLSTGLNKDYCLAGNQNLLYYSASFGKVECMHKFPTLALLNGKNERGQTGRKKVRREW